MTAAGPTIAALKFPDRHTFVQRVATSGCRFGSRGLRAPGTGGCGGTSEQVERCPTKGSPDMRASMAYFAGAGTVIVAIAGGVGGGLLIADMVSPKSPKQGVEQTRLERRMSPEPIPAANEPAEPVQYLAASQLPPSGAAAEAVPAGADASRQFRFETAAAGRHRGCATSCRSSAATRCSRGAARGARANCRCRRRRRQDAGRRFAAGGGEAQGRASPALGRPATSSTKTRAGVAGGR